MRAEPSPEGITRYYLMNNHSNIAITLTRPLPWRVFIGPLFYGFVLKGIQPLYSWYLVQILV